MSRFARYKDWPRREWPAFLAIIVLILSNIWYYGIYGAEWSLASPTLVLAIAVFLVGELIRKLL